MSAVFLSDVHLKDATSVKTQLVLRFLREKAVAFDRVYILGDFFDVWPGTNRYLIQNFQPVLEALRELVEGGREVHYVEGNHDFRLGRYFSKQLNIRVHPNAHTEVWAGRRIYMVHGDLGNPQEKGYRVLRALLRQDVVHWVAAAVPPRWLYALGDSASRLSRKLGAKRPPDEEHIRSVYRQTAREQFEKGFDVVIMGHTHLPDHHREEVGGRQCVYYNLGDWVRNFTYLEFDGSEFYTRTHPVTTP